MKESNSFVYQAAHDLRAPLMSVKGLLTLIKTEKDKKNFDHYFYQLERCVDKMNQSINDIISYSKGENVKGSLQEVDLNTLAEDALQSLSFMKDAKSVRISLAMHNVKLISDYKILLSIFNNLISNVIRYRDPDKFSFLNISASSSNKSIEIVFEDNGIGIDKSLHEKIFDRFFTGNSDQGGTGLGLYMVKRMVNKLAGEIYLQSKAGEGTTFIIQIPKHTPREMISNINNQII